MLTKLSIVGFIEDLALGWRKEVFTISTEQYTENGNRLIVQLTKRETEVLRLVLEGKSSKQVALDLCCSKRTIDFHLARVYEKLEVSNRVQAIHRAAALGIIEMPIGA